MVDRVTKTAAQCGQYYLKDPHYSKLTMVKHVLIVW